MTVMSAASSVDEIRARFDAVTPKTVGLEEEVMLLDPETLDLAPVADEILAGLEDELDAAEPWVKGELPASHVELVTRPAESVPQAIAQLAAARRALVAHVRGRVLPAAAGVHPFADPFGQLSEDARYDHTRERFGPVARLQLVCALQVHVAVRGADRALAVHNALRSYLPELAALAANAPFLAGSDSGLASVRPVIGRTLPRQGVPPAIRDWHSFLADVEWGAASGTMPGPGQWWWELRPHPLHGTLEIRVPDAQATVEHAAAIAAVAHCLVATVARRVDAGPEAEPAATWRIEENRWSAARDGVNGEMVDLVTGAREPTRERLERLLVELEPAGAELGCAAELAVAHELAAANGAMRLRAAAGAQGDVREATRWLADAFAPPAAGEARNA
jgi:carboxylate-amine ligase